MGRTGNRCARHEGMFYSLVTLLRKVATSIGIPLALLVLDWSGYVSNAAVQKPSAVKAIMMMTGPIPAFFMFLGIIFAIYYPAEPGTACRNTC